MGKTTFMEQLAACSPGGQGKLVKLGEYAGDPNGLRQDVAAYLNAASSFPHAVLLLDGLDEAPELAGAILRLLRGVSASTTVWIASRDVTAMRSIRAEMPHLKAYSMAPLSLKDIRDLTSGYGVDPEDFLAAVRRQGVTGICAKPLGCELAVSVFRENGLTGISQRSLWQRGIERLCDETPSTTRRLSPPSVYPLDQIVRASAWIAMCLTLSNKAFVWADEDSHCPQQCTPISSLASDAFPLELLRLALERGTFSPLGDGRFRFGHAVYRDFLAAYGLTLFVPSDQWLSLVLTAKRSVFPQRQGVVAWLASFNQGFLSEMSGLQPELVLSSVDSVQAIGPGKLCNALLERADSLSYQQMHLPLVSGNLFRLRHEDTTASIRACLLDSESSESRTELAIEIAEACKCGELADLFADMVLDRTRELRPRVRAGYAVNRLENQSAMKRLSDLLPIDPEDDPEDDLRGIVLRACWPDHLTLAELVQHLTAPQKANYGGAYKFFLDYDLPASLDSALSLTDATAGFDWVLSHLTEEEPTDSLGRLARAIYTVCWKWAGGPVITDLLAQGYVRALSEYGVPFLQRRYTDESLTLPLVTRERFLRDVDRRFAVLEAILAFPDEVVPDLSDIPISAYPLYTADDLPILLRRALADPSGQCAERWAACIKAVVPRQGVTEHADGVNELHRLRPDLIDSAAKIQADAEESAKRFAALDEKRQRDKADRSLKGAADQERIDKEIRDALHTSPVNPAVFEGISSWLNSADGIRSLGSTDIQQSPGWVKLTDAERRSFTDLAADYLTHATIIPTAPDQHRYAVARAMTLLRLRRPSIYNSLTEYVWRRCSVELLKASMHDNMDLLGPLLDTLSHRFPAVAQEALVAVLRQEIGRGFISILRTWGKRLNNAEARAVLQLAMAPALDHRQRYLIVDDLARRDKADIVRTYLDGLFSAGWNIPPDPEFHKLRRLAFLLSPASYISEVLAAIKSNPQWGREWIEAAIGGMNSDIQGALLTCEASDIANMYAWLHTEYPASTCPEHETVFSPGPLDSIHMLKTHLINHLTRSGEVGSSRALDGLLEEFPGDVWLRNCILEARSAEQATSLPTLSMVEIQKLCERKQSAQCLVDSIHDLHQLVLRTLCEYQTYLQGDTPAVGDLWNTAAPIRPKDEEYLSDHLKRYLDLRLTTEVVINREVQIRRKLFRDGTPGSRTDIWVQAFDSNGAALTVCIEVKCNWNGSAQTALSDQLISKYMSGGVAQAGILCLGWFECNAWDSADGRLAQSTAVWPDSRSAQGDLDTQVQRACEAGPLVSTVVTDCGLR